MKKKLVYTSLAALALASASGYYFMSVVPHQEAVAKFEEAAETVTEKNNDLQGIITEASKEIEKSAEPLEITTLDDLKETVEKAKQAVREVPEMADKTAEIKEQTAELAKPLDYTANKQAITDSVQVYKTSVKQLEQITNPSTDFIEERLKEIDTVKDTQGVTEDNDPNGNLNKQGGYTASVYFIDNQVTEAVDGANPIEKGTSAGGNVEAYKTKDEAEKRNAYLSTFDGQGSLNPGSHYVYGTVVIRTSEHLTATQQNELTEKIYKKLIEIK